jgi:hypothetical protein
MNTQLSTLDHDTLSQQVVALLNRQIEAQENLTTQLGKVSALLQGTLRTDFLELPKSDIYNYLWVASDLLIEAKTMSEKILDALLKEVPSPSEF